jgi:hypothetical protein
MRELLLFTVVTLSAISMANLQASPYQRGRGQDKGQGQDRGNSENGRGRNQDQGRVEKGRGRPAPVREFRQTDREMIARYYHGPRNLPPGLAKKVNRGDRLPPGWQKRFQPFPVVLERQLPPVPAGCARGIVDGYAVVYNRRTHVVLDIFLAFGR